MSAPARALPLPLGYVVPAIDSSALIARRGGGWLEVIVREVVPAAGSRLPEVVGIPRGSLRTTMRSVQWRPLGATTLRCGGCYEEVPDGVTFAEHAATSRRHGYLEAIRRRRVSPQGE